MYAPAQRIRELIAGATNDYSGVAARFRARTGTELAEPVYDAALAQRRVGGVSVVIPSYNGHATLPVTLASLERQLHRDFEVIVVDDGSDPPLGRLLDRLPHSFGLEHARHERSRGIAAARNTGIARAAGAAVVMLDDDMRVEPTLTWSMALRMQHTSDCLFVGFRENVEPAQFTPRAPPARLEGDWRCKTRDRGTFLCLTAPPVEPPRERRIYRLLDETRDFRDFGHGRVVGYWDLPQMVVGHTMAASREAIVACGGFDEEGVRGWGTDDLVFGAQMIANGHYVVPARDCVSRHPRHEGRKVSRRHQFTVELMANFRAYQAWLDEPPPAGPTPESVAP